MASSPEAKAEHSASAGALAFGQRLLEAFESIVDLPPIEREAALEALRIESPELERAVRALLARDDRTGPLDRPLASDLAPLLREALPELDPAPAQIGPYQVLRLLGEGGMGRVYLARRGEGPVTREVAVKLIRADRAGEGLLARFEAERRHLAALDHPGICRFIDADSLADGTPYVVMEAVHGEPIIDYCQRHALGLRARVELLRQLLAAVAHAHDRLLLHRDIKPHNVLVTADGQPKLLDFGLAKSIEDAHTSVTRTAERFFTPNASAPEQLLGQPAGVACDVYSLGALAYELLAGALPFDFHGLRAAEIERLILQVAPPLMSEHSTQPWARELRGDLDAIIATCLRKSPTERYPNIGALDAELQRWLEGRPVTARAPSWGYRARLFVRRHRTAVGLSAALGAAILAFGTGLALQSIELRAQRNLAVIERDRALQVVEILESAFRNADPGRTAGDNVTARQILDSAIPGINALEHDNPELFVRMAATLAKVEMDMAQSARAIAWVDRGIAANDKANLATSQSLVSLLTAGAMSLARSGDVDKADSYLERLRNTGNSSSPEYLIASARNLMPKGKRAEAIQLLSSAKETLGERSEDANDLTATELRWLMANCAMGLGKYDEAVEINRSTLEWQTSQLPDTHPWIQRTRTQLFSSLARTEPSQALIDEHRQLIDLLVAQHGPDSIEVGVNRLTLGTALMRMNRFQESAAEYSISLEISRKTRGPDHLSTLQTALSYASTLSQQNTPETTKLAIDILNETYLTLKIKTTPLAPIRAQSRIQLSNSMMDANDWAGAIRLLSSPEESESMHIQNKSIQHRLAEAFKRALGSASCSPAALELNDACDALDKKLAETKRLHQLP